MRMRVARSGVWLRDENPRMRALLATLVDGFSIWLSKNRVLWFYSILQIAKKRKPSLSMLSAQFLPKLSN